MHWGVDELAYPGSYFCNQVEAIARYQGELYVGGNFKTLGDVYSYCIGKWNGTTWDSLLIMPFRTNQQAIIGTLEIINDKLYIGGRFDSVAGQPCNDIAIWDGTNWNALGLPPAVYYSSSVNAICEYQGEIYVGGNFGSDLSVNEDTIKAIIRWDGTNWKSVGGEMRGTWSLVSDMVVYKNELYVAGNFFKADGNAGQEIQKWDGTQWSEVGGSLMGYNQSSSGTVFDMTVYNDKLYVVGQMEYSGGVSASKIAVWDGTRWCGLGSQFDGIGNAVGFYEDTLYMTGGFWTIDGDSIYRIAKWIGGDYVDVCSTLSENNQNDEVLIIFPNPTNELLFVENTLLKHKFYKIYDIFGKLVLTGSIKDKKVSIDVSSLNPGIYIFTKYDSMGYKNVQSIKLIKA